ncbi:DUF4097 family beta strand repeat-containing protein [Mucilaginibacter phenanthrenivorans]|uniref:DUF4097 family beta strand repeat-containing protein n=1 Tax=Mucilaginibacter phenanthrenivorans TaxID=1234842 RepID=UPI0021589C95|nr:DUF4097 family beta strand repeat-containing protein [Mucilaginibacter phenanthrenivorans]
MKKLLIPVLAGVGLCLAQITAHAQEYKTHISKEFTAKKAVAICNLDGSIRVEGYAGDKVIIEIDETITADDQKTVEEGKRDFKLGFDQKGDSVIAYTAYPYDTRPHRNWNRGNNDNHIEYQVKLQYTVKVPNQVDLYASTVNEGDIFVKNVYGVLKINNVNGGIEIANAKGTTSAHTVNGPVTVTYLRNPPEASSYYSVNGELNVTYPQDLSADVQFKSMNGEFFTDFSNAEVLPSRVSKTETKSGSGTTYKLSKASDIRFGSGGKTFKFETLNGNIYIKKQKQSR